MATKREKKLSVSTMNPVNEEDESTMTSKTLNDDDSESSFNIGTEQTKLRYSTLYLKLLSDFF